VINGSIAESPLRVLLKNVKWMGVAFGRANLEQVFVKSGAGPDRNDSVGLTTHFPFGSTRILADLVRDEYPIPPHIRREELRGDTRISSITHLCPRSDALERWPQLAGLLSGDFKLIAVTLEQVACEQAREVRPRVEEEARGSAHPGHAALQALLDKVESLAAEVGNRKLEHIYIWPVPKRVSVNLTTHFPFGPGRVLEDFIGEDPPPAHIRREEIRGGARISSITFICLRKVALAMWPEVGGLLAAGADPIAITLEELAPGA
jgi:hypothetical protein